MRTKLRILSGVAAGLSAIGMLVAVPGAASAEVERCSTPVFIANGVTGKVCIDVTLGTGRAKTRILYNHPGVFVVVEGISSTIHRNSDHATNCCFDLLIPSDAPNDAFEVDAVANQIPGVQAWFASGTWNGIAFSSPTVFDT
jgi:hypothetical protein